MAIQMAIKYDIIHGPAIILYVSFNGKIRVIVLVNGEN